MYLTELADVLRKAGLDVVEEPGWKQRGHGGMQDVLGVTCHHTANGGAKGVEPSRTVVRDGRPGLDGPLAQLLLRKDGVYRVIAAGLCYHAGVSKAPQYGNAHRIGIEAEAKGVPGTIGDWPAIQMAAFHLGCKALMKHYGFGITNVLGHKETCSPPGRKSDPSFSMDSFRDAVLKASPIKVIQEEIVAALTEAETNHAVWSAKAGGPLNQTAGGALLTTMNRVGAENLQAQVAVGIKEAMGDPNHPLNQRLAKIDQKLDRLLQLHEASPPPASAGR